MPKWSVEAQAAVARHVVLLHININWYPTSAMVAPTKLNHIAAGAPSPPPSAPLHPPPPHSAPLHPPPHAPSDVLCGGAAGCTAGSPPHLFPPRPSPPHLFSVVITNPVDMARTRLQVQGNLLPLFRPSDT